MKFLKILLFPVSILYGIITFVRNKLFDFGILKTTSFSIPVISVGNIKVGGTGKTPHIEYLVRLISNDYNTAILSRGYGRKTKGYILANNNSTAEQIGDEPKQYQTKFKNIDVAVCEKRVVGVQNLLEDKPTIDIILLDDAYQHRYIKPKASILLKEFSSLGKFEFMLPTGTNREYKKGIKRADIIIISKSPEIVSKNFKLATRSQLKLKSHQKLYFSHIKYGSPTPLFKEQSEIKLETNFQKTILLVTGIANPYPLKKYLTNDKTKVILLKYDDHYRYSTADLLYIRKKFDSIVGVKVLLTTEKDTTRLQEPNILEITKQLPFYYVPIEVEFDGQDKKQFKTQIKGICQN